MKKIPNDENRDYYSYFQRGNVRLVTKKYEGAIEDYNKAIELKPDYAPIYSFRGYAYELNGKVDRAIEDYNQSDTTQERLCRSLWQSGCGLR